MKKIITVIMITAVLFTLSACDKKTTNTSTTAEDPKPHTITKQEVARIALVEANQFITNAQTTKDIDLSKAQETYKKAQSAYDAGHFKQAQKLAVDVRLMVQDLTVK